MHLRQKRTIENGKLFQFLARAIALSRSEKNPNGLRYFLMMVLRSRTTIPSQYVPVLNLRIISRKRSIPAILLRREYPSKEGLISITSEKLLTVVSDTAIVIVVRRIITL